MFHLAAPPGFRGFDPQGKVTYYRRHLPHWRQEGATYFVTFRLADSLPKKALHELSAMTAESLEQETEKHPGKLHRCAEKWLDQGYGSCLLAQAQVREIVKESLLTFDGKDYELGSFVIMPNHVHAVIRPFHQSLPLEKILQGRKQRTAREINRLSGKTGSLWQPESFDRIIRDPEHLWQAVRYIGNNPGKACLKEGTSTRWVTPAWKALGWDFEMTDS